MASSSTEGIEGVIRLNVTKEEDARGIWCSSLPVEIGGFSWVLQVTFNYDSCCVRLVCNEECPSSLWTCKASFESSIPKISSSSSVTKTHLFSAQQPTVDAYNSRIGYVHCSHKYPIDVEATIKIHTEIGFRVAKLTDFHQNTKHSDVVLKVSGRRFHVNKSILSIHSTFFDSLFNSDFQEKNQSEIELSDLDPEEFEVFLNIIYPSSQIITDKNVASLLKLADRFNVDSVTKACEDYLSTPEHCKKMESLKLAGQYKLPKVVWLCLDQMKDAEAIRKFARQRSFDDLTSTIKLSFFEKIVQF